MISELSNILGLLLEAKESLRTAEERYFFDKDVKETSNLLEISIEKIRFLQISDKKITHKKVLKKVY